MSGSDSLDKEGTPAGEMPADILLVPQPSSEVTTQKQLSCGFQPPPFPFQAKSTSLTSLREQGLAVPIKTALNIWFNSAKVLLQLEFAFLALSWELFVEPRVVGDTNFVVSSSKTF